MGFSGHRGLFNILYEVLEFVVTNFLCLFRQAFWVLVWVGWLAFSAFWDVIDRSV